MKFGLPRIIKNVFEKDNSKVPEWNTYFPDLVSATDEQRGFYKYWLKKFNNGEFVDIKGNLSYVFLYLYDLIEICLKNNNIDYMLNDFEKVRMGYGHYAKLGDYLNYWTSDLYIYLGEYDKAWQYYRKGERIDLDNLLNNKSKCKDTSINGFDLLGLSEKKDLTNFGKKHKEQIANVAAIFLKDFEREHEKNFVDYFSNIENLSKNAFSEMIEFFNDEKEFVMYRDISIRDNKIYPNFYERYLFSGVPKSELPHIKHQEIPLIVAAAIKNQIKWILREGENTVRDEFRLPRVGEGWISESELYYKICEVFPNEKIIHHGRPIWLSPQHLDVYFPMKNIGIEYQGKQHVEPIEYFGGINALEKRIKLDKRKERLCAKNGCKLVLVFEGYDFEEIIKQITEHL